MTDETQIIGDKSSRSLKYDPTLAAKINERVANDEKKANIEKRLRKVQEIKQEQGEIEKKREDLLEKLSLDPSRQAQFKEYLDKLYRFHGTDEEHALHAFTKHPDFTTIYNQAETIPTARDKWAFILRKAYEIGQETGIPTGNVFHSYHVSTKRALEKYGLYLLCPFYKEDLSQPTKESCLISGETIASACSGEYDICSIFEEMSKKAASGQITLPEIKRSSPEVQVPKIKVDPVDLRDLDDWWKNEGKYE